MIQNIIDLLKEIVEVNPENNTVRYWKLALASSLHGSNWNNSILQRINSELELQHEIFRIEDLDQYCIMIKISKGATI